MQKIKCDCGAEIFYIDNVAQMQQDIIEHVKTCTAKNRSFPDAQKIILMSKVTAIKSATLANDSFLSITRNSNVSLGGKQ